MKPNEFRANYRIAIIGAGLVGLVLAIIAREAGYRVEVFDGDDELKEIGAGIILPANACRVLSQAGVLQEIQSHAVAPQQWVSHSYKTGAVLSCMNLEPCIQDKYGVPFLVIHRPDLRRILFEKARARGAYIHLGTKIDIQRTDFEKNLLYAVSGAAFKVDLIIAADGQQSEARELLAGSPNQPRPTGKMVNRVLMSIETMKDLGMNNLISPPCIHVWLGPKGLAVGYLLKNVFNFVLTCSSEGESIFVGPKPVKKEQLQAAFRDWDPQIRSLIDNGRDYLKWLLLDSDNKPSSWIDHSSSKLALALTGDAAHAIGPYIGSGAALGFESASVLANLLAQATEPSNISQCLSIYESLRQPRTDLVSKVTQKMARTWMLSDGPLQAERDKIFLYERPPLTGYPNALQDPFFQHWLYTFDGRAEAEAAWKKHHSESSQ